MDDLDYEERDYGEMVLAEAEESAEIIEREKMLDERIDEVTEQSYAKGKASAQAEIDALVTALDMMKDKYMAVQYPMMWLHDVVKIDPEVEQADRLTNKHKHKGLRAKGNTVLVPADRLAKMKTEIKEKQYAINLALELVRQMDSTKFDSITAKQYEKLQCHLEMSTG